MDLTAKVSKPADTSGVATSQAASQASSDL